MGYRSEVVLILPKNEYKSALKLFDDKFGKDVKHILTLDGCDGMTIRDKYYVLHYNHIKWYESYPEIELLYNTLNARDESSFAIIRVGEEFGDMSHEGECDILDEASVYAYQGIDVGWSDVDVDVDPKMFDEIRNAVPKFVIEFGKVEVSNIVW